MYFPKSQIKTNLYSNGEYLYITTQESYIGPYYKTSSGKTFTGDSPNNPPNFEIILNPDVTITNGKIDNIDPVGQPPSDKITYVEPNFLFFNQSNNYFPCKIDSSPNSIQQPPPLKIIL